MAHDPKKKTSARDAARALRIRLELERQAGLDLVRRPVAPAPPRAVSSPPPPIDPASRTKKGNQEPRTKNQELRPPIDPASLTEKGRLLLPVAEKASACVACPLHQGRTHVVFGVGNPDTKLLFIGEAPGFDEDKQGEPFVGRAGKLLDQLLAEAGIPRAAIYITNTVKCRPPDNRTPEPSEIGSCASFLDRQIEIIAPKIIVTLGNVPTKALLNTTTGIVKLRGKRMSRGDILVIPTFHPAYLLRNPPETARSREDFSAIAAAWKALPS